MLTRVLRVRLGVAMLFLCAQVAPQDAPPAGTLRSYLQAIALQQLASRKELVSEIRSPEQFEKRRSKVRQTLLKPVTVFPELRPWLDGMTKF